MKNDNLISGIIPVAKGVWMMKHVFVNFFMIQNEENDHWVLIDTGLKWSAGKIKRMAENIFGQGSRPECIILTHGHFDHTGSVAELAEAWDVPVYAHYMEVPYLTGKSSYPPPDPTVGGGLMTSLSFTYPTFPINIWNRINALPSNGKMPGLPEWKYIHTPGHTPGHVSLFRSGDKVLIAGDAFVTTSAESALSIMLQSKKLSGPPRYLTIDWDAAHASVKELEALQPKIAATGHGLPMHGEQLRSSLKQLSQHFNELAVPHQGRYVNEPAIADTNGIIYIPAENNENKMNAFLFKTAAITAALVFTLFVKKRNKTRKSRQHELLLNFEYNF